MDSAPVEHENGMKRGHVESVTHSFSAPGLGCPCPTVRAFVAPVSDSGERVLLDMEGRGGVE